MRTRPFGASGPSVPVLGQGTWEIEREPRRAVRALRAGIDAGMSHIDSAEMYGAGRAEEIVGEAIAGRREQVFLASKVLPSNASRAGTIRACEASLRRLRTDHLDLFLLHWPGEHPLEDTLLAFETLRSEGKILLFGLSNFDERETERAVTIAGPGRIACNQVLYHLGERHIEHAVIPTCARHGIALVAYSPFGSGSFPGPGSAGGRLLAEIAAGHGATERQVALAYLTRHPGSFAIPKAARVEHVLENVGADGMELSADEIARIGAAFPLADPKRDLPMI